MEALSLAWATKTHWLVKCFTLIHLEITHFEGLRLKLPGLFPFFPSSGPIPVSASAAVVEAALNSLWSIRDDTVQVTKQDDSQGSHYTVTFNSDRGTKTSWESWELFGYLRWTKSQRLSHFLTDQFVFFLFSPTFKYQYMDVLVLKWGISMPENTIVQIKTCFLFAFKGYINRARLMSVTFSFHGPKIKCLLHNFLWFVPR